MLEKHRRKVVVAAAGVAAAAVTAGAFAATGALSSREESQAVMEDAAEQLGVEPAELSAALKQALKNRVDAAVAAGRLTEEQATELKERIDADEFPLFGVGHGVRGHHVHLGHLEAAASFLGMTEEKLRSAVEDGQTLAEVAEEQDKPVAGLVDAVVAAEKEELEQAVADGRLTEEQQQSILSSLEERITALVNGERGIGRAGFGRPGHGPPPAHADAA
jgi:hypothetical protein